MEDAIGAALEQVIPDAANQTGDGPDEYDFEALNKLLTWTPENGPITSLMDALTWFNRLFESLPNLEASKVKSLGNFRDILGILEVNPGRMSELYRDTMMLRDICMKQYEMCLETSNRDLNGLKSFIDHFLGHAL